MTSDSRTHHQKSSLLRFVSNYLALLVIYIGETEKYFIDLLNFLNISYFSSIAKVNSGRSIPKAEVTLANSQTEVTLANFYISVLFHAIV